MEHSVDSFQTGSKSETFEFDFASRSNCAVLRRVKPGQEVGALVRQRGDPVASAILAKGTRSADGTLFNVEVKTGLVSRKFAWRYGDLLSQIDQRWPQSVGNDF